MSTSGFQFDLSRLGELGQEMMSDKSAHSVREFLFAALRHGECVMFNELLETLYEEGWKREKLEGIIAFLSHRFPALHAMGKIDPAMIVALLTSASITVPADYDVSRDSLRKFTPTDRVKRNINYLIKLYNRGGFLEFTKKVEGDLKEHVLLEADRDVLKQCIEPAVKTGGKIDKSLLELACQRMHGVSLVGRSEVKLKDLTKELFESWRLAEVSKNPPVAKKPVPKPELARRKVGPTGTAFGCELHRLIGCVVRLLEEKQIAWPKDVMVGWTARKLAEAMGAAADDPVITESLAGLAETGLKNLCQLTPFQSVYRWQPVEWGVVTPTTRRISVMNDRKIQQFVDAMVRDAQALRTTRLHIERSVPGLIPARPVPPPPVVVVQSPPVKTAVVVVEPTVAVIVEVAAAVTEVVEEIAQPVAVESTTVVEVAVVEAEIVAEAAVEMKTVVVAEAEAEEVLAELVSVASSVLEENNIPEEEEVMTEASLPVVGGTPVAVETHRVAGLLLALLEANGWPVGLLSSTVLDEIVLLVTPDSKQPAVIVNTNLLGHGFSRVYMRSSKPSIFRREAVTVSSADSKAKIEPQRVTDEAVGTLAMNILFESVREIAYIEKWAPQLVTNSVPAAEVAEPIVAAQPTVTQPLVMEAASAPVHFDPPAELLVEEVANSAEAAVVGETKTAIIKLSPKRYATFMALREMVSILKELTKWPEGIFSTRIGGSIATNYSDFPFSILKGLADQGVIEYLLAGSGKQPGVIRLNQVECVPNGDTVSEIPVLTTDELNRQVMRLLKDSVRIKNDEAMMRKALGVTIVGYVPAVVSRKKTEQPPAAPVAVEVQVLEVVAAETVVAAVVSPPVAVATPVVKAPLVPAELSEREVRVMLQKMIWSINEQRQAREQEFRRRQEAMSEKQRELDELELALTSWQKGDAEVVDRERVKMQLLQALLKLS